MKISCISLAAASENSPGLQRRVAARALMPSVMVRLLLAALIFFASVPAVAADRPRDRPTIASRIKREPVSSSGLAAVGYSRQLQALEIEFRDGSIYRYADVPRSLYRDLMSAESKARFYNRHVRRKFRSVRVRPRREP